MKKIFVALVAFATLCGCNGEKKNLNYRGLSMEMSFKVFCDSLTARGFVTDSAMSAKMDSTGKAVVMGNPSTNFRLVLAQRNDTLIALQENYDIHTNDSTRQMWQQLRDQMEKDLGTWPNCPILKDDHKVAKFETDGGFITITLENTYKPTLSVLYQLK